MDATNVVNMPDHCRALTDELRVTRTERARTA
jgi:hypothetical protein